MKQLASIAWKEWHEARAFLFIALAIFIGLPAIGALEYTIQYSRHFIIETTPWVLGFSGILAVFVGVAITCRDFQGHLEDFWRSRPFGVSRSLAIKYFVGLLVVLAGSLLPLLTQWLVNRRVVPDSKNEVLPFIIFLPLIWMIVYSVGFLSGCLIRRAAHATAIAFTAILLIYFLLVILPPIRWFPLQLLTQDFGSLQSFPFEQTNFGFLFFNFARPALVLALILLLISLIGVRRGWHIESGRKLLYGAVSAALLALIASAGAQLSSNLPVVFEADLPQHEQAILINCDGHTGYIFTYCPSGKTASNNINNYDPYPQFYRRSITLTESGITIGDASQIDSNWELNTLFVRPPQHPDVGYYLGNDFEPGAATEHFALEVAALNRNPLYTSIPLWDRTVVKGYNWGNRDTSVYIHDDRLYVLADHLVTFDISDPYNPKKITDLPNADDYGISYLTESGQLKLALPPIPELSPRLRIEAVLHTPRRESVSMEGDTLCTNNGFQLTLYRLTKLTDTFAVFDQIAVYNPTLLQRVFGNSGYGTQIQLRNGLLFQGNSRTDLLYYAGTPRGTFNARMTLFDTRGDNPLRVIGHFAAPGARVVCPLPDGRALIGGDKIWLIGATSNAAQHAGEN